MNRSRRAFAFLLLALWLPAHLAPALAAGLTRAEERRVGAAIFRQMSSNMAFAEDAYIDIQVRSVAEKLYAASNDNPFPLTVKVVADATVNASATPGGYIYVTSGALLAMTHEEELAAVLAHEIGHVQGRHIASRVEAGQRMQALALAAILAGIFLGGVNPDMGMAVGAFGLAGAQAGMLAYSRTDEADADSRALRTLKAAGYTGWGLVSFMETLDRLSGLPEGYPPYLLTHPMPENRADTLAASLGSNPRVVTPEELKPFRLLHARVLAFDPRPWGLKTALQEADASPKSYEAHLSAAILLRAAGRYDEADEFLDRAAALEPVRVETTHERAQNQIRRGNLEAARDLLMPLNHEDLATLPILRDLAWLLVETGEVAGGLAIYDDLARLDPQWEKLSYQRGLALGKTGRTGEGFLELGKYFLLRDPERAARHFASALETLPPGPLATEARALQQDAAKRAAELKKR